MKILQECWQGLRLTWLSKLPDEIIKRRLLQFEAAFFFALFLRFGAGLPLVWYRRRQGVNRAAWAVFAPLWGMPSKGRGGVEKSKRDLYRMTAPFPFFLR